MTYRKSRHYILVQRRRWRDLCDFGGGQIDLGEAQALR
jgi:hypothetical protein